MYCLWQDLSHGTIIFDLVTLTLNFDLLLKNFNLGCYLVMVAARRASLSSDNSYYDCKYFNLKCVIPYLENSFYLSGLNMQGFIGYNFFYNLYKQIILVNTKLINIPKYTDPKQSTLIDFPWWFWRIWLPLPRVCTDLRSWHFPTCVGDGQYQHWSRYTTANLVFRGEKVFYLPVFCLD